MASDIPTAEPIQLTAGDTVSWSRSLADYSAADGWVLSYALVQRVTGLRIIILASASGADHLVSVTAAESAGWTAGEYDGQGYVGKTTERYQVWKGTVVILPNYGGEGEVGDTRSQAKIILDFIDASFTKLVQKQTVEATIEGVDLKFRSLEELTKARNYWGNIYAEEERAAAGRTGRKRILARFTQPE
jgi:hypothetical protein